MSLAETSGGCITAYFYSSYRRLCVAENNPMDAPADPARKQEERVFSDLIDTIRTRCFPFGAPCLLIYPMEIKIPRFIATRAPWLAILYIQSMEKSCIDSRQATQTWVRQDVHHEHLIVCRCGTFVDRCVLMTRFAITADAIHRRNVLLSFNNLVTLTGTIIFVFRTEISLVHAIWLTLLCSFISLTVSNTCAIEKAEYINSLKLMLPDYYEILPNILLIPF